MGLSNSNGNRARTQFQTCVKSLALMYASFSVASSLLLYREKERWNRYNELCQSEQHEQYAKYKYTRDSDSAAAVHET